MKIYTKTGDDGSTGLVGGSRVRKDDLRISVVGTLDELNAHLGICRAQTATETGAVELEWVQARLFDIGSELATPTDSKHYRPSISDDSVTRLEKRMDLLTASLPDLRNFILPGGSNLAANLHLARCVARRAERELVAFSQFERVRSEILAFVNRLSDWLFVEARAANSNAGVSDIIWSGDQRS